MQTEIATGDARPNGGRGPGDPARRPATLLDRMSAPADLRELNGEDLARLATEVRSFVVDAVSRTGGHLGSNLGAVELTFAIHRVFDSPKDIVLWDTGHQAYVHKILTGRRDAFARLRQAGGLSGYPSRAESEHDWVENSHASTILSYAHGVAASLHLAGDDVGRRVVAIIGDGSMTGGMAYEALNNLGHSGSRVVIVLNDNGRSYAPTVSRLVTNLTRVRATRAYVRRRRWAEAALRRVPRLGPYLEAGVQGLKIAVRHTMLNPKRFFEALGVRYVGPIDGHDVAEMERVLRRAADLDEPDRRPRPHTKGKGHALAEHDAEKCLHDTPAFDRADGPPAGGRPRPATPGPSRRPCWRPPPPTRGWWPSPRRCPVRPGCCRCRPASRRACSTSASPSSTRSPPPRAWPWAGCDPSWPSTPRSSAGPSTR